MVVIVVAVIVKYDCVDNVDNILCLTNQSKFKN